MPVGGRGRDVESKLMTIVADGSLVCKLCGSVMAKKGESELGIPQKIQLHFELFHDRYIKVQPVKEG